MRQKPKFIVALTIVVLLLSIIIPCVRVNYADAQANHASTTQAASVSRQLDYGDLSVTEHKISAAELAQYQGSVGTYQEGQNYNKIVAGHGTGLSPPTASEWSGIAQNGYVIEEVNYQGALPTVVDQSTSPWFPPIGDQGNQGSCSLFADVYYTKTYQEAKEHQWNLSQATWVGRDPGSGGDNGHVADEYQNRVMSPAFVYHLINNGTHIGSSLEAPIMVMCSIGVSSWQNMPYDQNDISSWPSEAAWAQAPYYRSNSTYLYQYIFANQTNGITNLKNWLAAGNVAVVAMDAQDNLNPIWRNNSQDLFTLDNYVNGPLDHAQTIVGYNDNITYMENGTLHSGAFKIVNSWGIGGDWENVADGCYWMSYQVISELSAARSPVVLSQDLTGYQPEILATFNINHPSRSDCNITFGLGTPGQPIVKKTFDRYFSEGDLYLGGQQPFCTNNIVLDLTEFKSYMTCLYNQPFFMQVYDSGTSGTGTINYFAVGATASTQAPLQTVTNHYVNLTLTTSLAPPILSVSPTSGPPSGEITLSGVGFSGNPVNISYLNPTTHAWVPIATNQAVPSMNFTYSIHAPDLLQNNPSGDNPAGSDAIVFRVQDNGNYYNSTAPYTEYHRGFLQVADQTASGLFGSNTNLATAAFVQSGQSIAVAGKWLSPGSASIFWDSTILATQTVDAAGSFSATVTVPTTSAGQHTLTVDDGASNVTVTISRLPAVSSDYADSWQTQNFPINLTADYTGVEIQYKINNGQTHTVSADGQPVITSEGSGNTVEYWGTWNVYGSGSRELSHITQTGIKLDKTAPFASMWINGGATQTTARTVTLTMSAVDSTSGVKEMRFSNDNSWSQATWEPYAASKTWELTIGAGAKTVYLQVQDKAGLVATTSAKITLEAAQPASTATPSPTAKPTPTIPEFSAAVFVGALVLLATLLLLIRRQICPSKMHV